MEQYDYEKKETSGEYGRDLFQEYVQSLEEDKEEQQDDLRDGAHLSSQVEQDLLNYARSNRRTTPRNNTSRRRKKSSSAAVAAIIASVALIIGITSFSIAAYTNNTNYDEYYGYEPEEWTEEYNYTYLEPQQLVNPTFMIGETEKDLGMTLKDFLEPDWKLSYRPFSGTPEEVGADPVTVVIQDEYGERIGELTLVSMSGETVPLEEATVIGITVDDDNYLTMLRLPGDIGIDSYSGYIEDTLQEAGVTWTKTGYSGGMEYRIVNPVETDSGYKYYNISILMNGDYVEGISLILSQETLY